MFLKTTVLGLACAVCTAAAAYAQPRDVIATTRVNYADLDLGTEAGAAALVRRIDAAARRVCRVEVTAPLELQRQEAVQACREKASRQAVQDVGSPLVSALHAASRGGQRFASN